MVKTAAFFARVEKLRVIMELILGLDATLI